MQNHFRGIVAKKGNNSPKNLSNKRNYVVFSMPSILGIGNNNATSNAL
jgi:hypothetical protein